MSAAPHANTSFELHIKAVGIGKCDPETRAPKALTLPFTAQCYDLGDKQSPWVGDVDVERYFFEAYARDGLAEPSRHSSPSPRGSLPATSLLEATEGSPPSYPGYRVPAVGQLQLLIKTPTQAVKAFIMPYDLRGVPVGGRLLARERTYVSRSSPSPSTSNAGSPAPSPSPSPQRPGESLRFAVQLQFVCTKAPSANRKDYHISRSVKLVFGAGPGSPEYDGESRVERHDEIVAPTEPKRRRSSLVPSVEAQRRRSLAGGSPPGSLETPRRRRSLLASSPDSPLQCRRSTVTQSPEINSGGSPRQTLGQTLESWAAVRADWQLRMAEQMKRKVEEEERGTSDAERPVLRRKPTRLEGFEPLPARPTSPTPPQTRPSLLSTLRAASPAPHAPAPSSLGLPELHSNEANAPLTPKKNRPMLDTRATPPVSPRRRTSVVDRELSELLRSTHV